jgi:hypothetical protein
MVFYHKYFQLFLFFYSKKTSHPPYFIFLLFSEIPPLVPSKSHHYDPKQQEFKVQTNKVFWLSLNLNCLVHFESHTQLTPLIESQWTCWTLGQEWRQFCGFDMRKLIFDLFENEGSIKNLVDMAPFILQLGTHPNLHLFFLNIWEICLWSCIWNFLKFKTF